MHSIKIEMILLVWLLVFFCIPSSFGIIKSSASLPSTFNASDWDVSVSSSSSSTMQLTANSSTATYNIVVTSTSEVDTNYSIIVRNLPSGVQVKLDNGNFEPYSSTVTFPNVGTILYGANPNTATHTLTFRANNGATIVSNQQISVDVEFVQDM